MTSQSFQRVAAGQASLDLPGPPNTTTQSPVPADAPNAMRDLFHGDEDPTEEDIAEVLSDATDQLATADWSSRCSVGEYKTLLLGMWGLLAEQPTAAAKFIAGNGLKLLKALQFTEATNDLCHYALGLLGELYAGPEHHEQVLSELCQETVLCLVAVLSAAETEASVVLAMRVLCLMAVCDRLKFLFATKERAALLVSVLTEVVLTSDDNPSRVTDAMNLLWRLSHGNDEIQIRLIQAEILGVLCSALRKHRVNVTTIEAVLGMLCCFDAGVAGNRREATNLITEVLEAIELHAEKETVVGRGCWVLLALTGTRQSNTLVETSVDYMRRALRNHAGVPAVVDPACTLLAQVVGLPRQSDSVPELLKLVEQRFGPLAVTPRMLWHPPAEISPSEVESPPPPKEIPTPVVSNVAVKRLLAMRDNLVNLSARERLVLHANLVNALGQAGMSEEVYDEIWDLCCTINDCEDDDAETQPQSLLSLDKILEARDKQVQQELQSLLRSTNRTGNQGPWGVAEEHTGKLAAALNPPPALYNPSTLEIQRRVSELGAMAEEYEFQLSESVVDLDQKIRHLEEGTFAVPADAIFEDGLFNPAERKQSEEASEEGVQEGKQTGKQDGKQDSKEESNEDTEILGMPREDLATLAQNAVLDGTAGSSEDPLVRMYVASAKRNRSVGVALQASVCQRLWDRLDCPLFKTGFSNVPMVYPSFEHIREPKLGFLEPCLRETKDLKRTTYVHFAHRHFGGSNEVVYDTRRTRGTVPAKGGFSRSLPLWYTLQDRRDATLLFESRFEGGNLMCARKVDDFEYDLYLRPDYRTFGYTQWFYFSMENMKAGKEYRFNIVNLYKSGSLYNKGLQPLLYSQKEAQHGRAWRHSGFDILYFNRGMNPRKSSRYKTLTFKIIFPHNHDKCWLAHSYPYTFTDLQRYLDGLMRSHDRAPYINRGTLCTTLAGNVCDLLTVSAPGTSEELKRKQVCVITARVHPGETQASWMMEGVINFLTGSHPKAESLRQHFVFKLVPMLNPDGVVLGNSRCGLGGVDLNRYYPRNRCTLRKSPTIFALKAMILEQQKEGQGGVYCFCDLHGHSIKRDVFMYGNSHKNLSPDNRYRPLVFAHTLAKQCDLFSLRASSFATQRNKRNAGRYVVWNELGVRNCFTMEASFCGASATPTQEAWQFHTRHLEKFARKMCYTIHICGSDALEFEANTLRSWESDPWYRLSSQGNVLFLKSEEEDRDSKTPGEEDAESAGSCSDPSGDNGDVSDNSQLVSDSPIVEAVPEPLQQAEVLSERSPKSSKRKRSKLRLKAGSAPVMARGRGRRTHPGPMPMHLAQRKAVLELPSVRHQLGRKPREGDSVSVKDYVPQTVWGKVVKCADPLQSDPTETVVQRHRSGSRVTGCTYRWSETPASAVDLSVESIEVRSKADHVCVKQIVCSLPTINNIQSDPLSRIAVRGVFPRTKLK